MTQTYSREEAASLPTNTDDLGTAFVAGDYTAVATAGDASYVSQSATGDYAIFEFKDSVTASSVDITWTGKTDLDPATNNVILQAWNTSGTPAWETLATYSTSTVGSNFTIERLGLSTTNYLVGGTTLTCRVYQTATSATLMDSLTADNTYLIMDTGDYHYLAQTFVGDGNKVSSVKVKLATGGSNTPDGNMWVEIWTMKNYDGGHAYAITAPSYGIPDTYQSCISDTIPCTSFTTTPTLTEFTFSGANQFQTVSSTVYCLVVKTSNTQGASPMQLYYNNAGNGPGNISDWTDAGGAWAYLEWYVMHYEVWGTP